MQPQQRIAQTLEGHLEAVRGCFDLHAEEIAKVAHVIANAFDQGGKVLACGNGGSACDAMHFAGECVGRFVSDRTPLPALALTADPGILTAIGNDYGFDIIFERQVQAHGRPRDVLIGISTSGKSENVLRALRTAKAEGLYTVLLTGERGKDVAGVDSTIWVPSLITAHIQETHITVLQLIIAIIEDKLFK